MLIHIWILFSQLSTMLFISMAMVMGPTPPGTGVIYEHYSIALSKSMSPTILRLGDCIFANDSEE